ncbi:hypothetical protein OC846_006766 [Tilletia horrida]|uniref:Uncharacterized protein n=1 Tax=Tilletia horrida TaxID=155126 RepID=A0AAN6JNE0_9BASI|nr:hypothetical protein OC846_006766 [Tilletia horrida]
MAFERSSVNALAMEVVPGESTARLAILFELIKRTGKTVMLEHKSGLVLDCAPGQNQPMLAGKNESNQKVRVAPLDESGCKSDM